MKLSQGNFRLDIRRRFFMERMVTQQNRLPKKVIMAPSLSELKECLVKMFSFRWTCDEQELILNHHYGSVPA